MIQQNQIASPSVQPIPTPTRQPHQTELYHQQSYYTKNKISISYQVMKVILGPRSIFNIYSLTHLIKIKQQYKEQKAQIEKLQKIYKYKMYACAAMSVALSLSLRRYFPKYFQSFKLAHIPMDLSILTFGIIFGTNFGASSVATQLYVLENSLIENKNSQMIEIIKKLQYDFHISQKQQLLIIAKKKQEIRKLTKCIDEYYEEKKKNNNNDQ